VAVRCCGSVGTVAQLRGKRREAKPDWEDKYTMYLTLRHWKLCISGHRAGLRGEAELGR
jgi:hypothetical protein